MVKSFFAKKSTSELVTKSLMLFAAILVVVAIVLGVVLFSYGGEKRTQDQAVDNTPTKTGGGQSPDCPDVRLVAVAGTHESAEDDDPYNPTVTALEGQPAMLWAITRPINEQYNKKDISDKRADAYTLPYNSGFKVLFSNNKQEKPFDQSVEQGVQALKDVLQRTAQECPATKFLLVGYSQGAIVVGDTAHDIGIDPEGIVPSDRILGVELLSDGRREPGVGNDIGTTVKGVGIEVALKNSPYLPMVSTFGGFTMRGGREGGFGVLQNKVDEICGVGDKICDVDPAISQDLAAQTMLPGELLGASGQHLAVHTGYGTTTYWKSPDGKAAVEWIGQKVMSLIESAPNTH